MGLRAPRAPWREGLRLALFTHHSRGSGKPNPSPNRRRICAMASGLRVRFLQEKAPLRTGLRIKGINVNRQLVPVWCGYSMASQDENPARANNSSRAGSWETRLLRQGSFRAYLDSCCTARAHNRSGSRSPCFANSIISLATSAARGSVRSVNRSCPTPPRTRLTTLQCLLGQTSDRVREIVVSARPATFSTCHIGKMELSHEASQVCSANAQSQQPSSVGIPRGREPRPGLFYVYGTVAHTTRTGKD